MEGKPQWEVLGETLVAQYYKLFDENRLNVLQFYHPTYSFLSFEDNRAAGMDGIKDIIENKMRFNKIVHSVTKCDCQPTSDSGVVVLVTGRLKTDEDPPHAFSQVFVVKPIDSGYYIIHDIFRLSIHDTA